MEKIQNLEYEILFWVLERTPIGSSAVKVKVKDRT